MGFVKLLIDLVNHLLKINCLSQQKAKIIVVGMGRINDNLLLSLE